MKYLLLEVKKIVAKLFFNLNLFCHFRLTIALFVYSNDRAPSDGPNETGGRADAAALTGRDAGARSHRGLADVETNDVDDVDNEEAKKDAVKKVVPVVVVTEKPTAKNEGGNK